MKQLSGSGLIIKQKNLNLFANQVPHLEYLQNEQNSFLFKPFTLLPFELDYAM